MPKEILYENVDALLNELKKIVEKSLECRIKINKDNVKLKIKTKRKLYTAVLTPERVGVSIDALKEKARELATQVGCKNINEIN